MSSTMTPAKYILAAIPLGADQLPSSLALGQTVVLTVELQVRLTSGGLLQPISPPTVFHRSRQEDMPDDWPSTSPRHREVMDGSSTIQRSTSQPDYISCLLRPKTSQDQGPAHLVKNGGIPAPAGNKDDDEVRFEALEDVPASGTSCAERANRQVFETTARPGPSHIQQDRTPNRRRPAGNLLDSPAWKRSCLEEIRVPSHSTDAPSAAQSSGDVQKEPLEKDAPAPPASDLAQVEPLDDPMDAPVEEFATPPGSPPTTPVQAQQAMLDLQDIVEEDEDEVEEPAAPPRLQPATPPRSPSPPPLRWPTPPPPPQRLPTPQPQPAAPAPFPWGNGPPVAVGMPRTRPTKWELMRLSRRRGGEIAHNVVERLGLGMGRQEYEEHVEALIEALLMKLASFEELNSTTARITRWISSLRRLLKESAKAAPVSTNSVAALMSSIRAFFNAH